MKRWMVVRMLVVTLTLAFEFSVWTYQAHRSKITNDCATFLQEHPDISGSCAAA